MRGRGDTFEPQNIEQGIMNVEGIIPSKFEVPCTIFDIQTANGHNLVARIGNRMRYVLGNYMT